VFAAQVCINQQTIGITIYYQAINLAARFIKAAADLPVPTSIAPFGCAAGYEQHLLGAGHCDIEQVYLFPGLSAFPLFGDGCARCIQVILAYHQVDALRA